MIKKILRKVIIKLNSPILTQMNKNDYQKKIEQAYKAGYNYHQKITKNEPEMIRWITREHYFDDKQDSL